VHEIKHHACAMGLEGIVAKRRDKPYQSGRSPHSTDDAGNDFNLEKDSPRN
jgi:hypothetical protein